MEEKIIQTIELENGYTLNIYDVSRKISDDAFLVKMRAVIDIEIGSQLFSSPLPEGILPEDIQTVLGSRTAWEYETERNFIMDHEKEGVLDSLVATFLDNLGQYMAKPMFPEKVVLKAYRDKTK